MSTTIPFADVTQEQRRQYREEGFFVTDVLFDESLLASLRSEFNRIWQETIEAAKDGPELEARLIRERPFISDLHARSQVCAALLKHPTMLELARQMIGPDVDVCYNQAVIKPPSGSTPNSFAWHQDAYYPCRTVTPPKWNEAIMLNGSRTFQGWLSLTRATVKNGALVVVPRMHRKGFLPHTQSLQTREWVAELDTTTAIPVELRAGQLLVFSALLPHSSGPNRTQETRIAYQFCYAQPGCRPPEDVYAVLRDNAAAARAGSPQP